MYKIKESLNMVFKNFSIKLFKKQLMRMVVNYYSHDLFQFIDDREILRYENGHIVYKDKKMDRGTIDILKKGADNIYNSHTWKILKSEIKYSIQKEKFFEQKDTNDILEGKIALRVLQTIDDKLKSLSSM